MNNETMFYEAAVGIFGVTAPLSMGVALSWLILGGSGMTPIEGEKSPPVPSGSCLFGHKWTKWVQDTNTASGEQVAIQHRYCIRCEKFQAEMFRL